MLDKESNSKPYLIGRATSLVETALGFKDIPREFPAKVAVNPLAKLMPSLLSAVSKDGNAELEDVAVRIGDIPPTMNVYEQSQFYVGYYHQNHHDSKIRIAKRLENARISKGLTQQQLSVISGIPQTNISRIESGKCNVSIETLSKLTSALSMNVVIE